MATRRKGSSDEPIAVTVHPLTPDRWADLERLFGPRGACAGCWCMWWRLARAEWEAGKGEGNRRALEAEVRGGRVPGLIAYDGEVPVGWVAVEPRAAYPRLARARTLAPVDDAPVWAITCFFVARTHRRRGLMRALIDAAAAHARAAGATLLEGYPVDLAGPTGDAFVYTGARSTFEAAGFEEVVRRSPTRPIVRLTLRGRRAPAARGRAPGRSTPRSSPTRSSRSRPGR
jgi:GNAT superfamily N-acetyltransferase